MRGVLGVRGVRGVRGVQVRGMVLGVGLGMMAGAGGGFGGGFAVGFGAGFGAGFATELAAAQLPLPEPVRADRPLTGREIGDDLGLWHALLAAEDRRARAPGDSAQLAEALTHPSPVIRRTAVRGAGRLESPGWIAPIAARLDDPDAGVRIEAANALAQAVFGGEGVLEAERALTEALEAILATRPVRDPAVGGALARALGRLRHPAPELAGAVTRAAPLLAALGGAIDEAHPEWEEAQLGVARGALFLLRTPQSRGVGSLRDPLLAHLDALLDGATGNLAVRRAAAAARVAATGIDPDRVARLLIDPDPEIRRIAATAVTPPLVEVALRDASASVRTEGVRGWARLRQWEGGVGCAPVVRIALEDPSEMVALAAVDALATAGAAGGCGAGAGGALSAQLIPLAGLAVSTSAPTPAPTPVSTSASSWHRPLRALTVLARLDPDAARGVGVPVAHPNPFARAQAARILQILFETDPPGIEAELRLLASASSSDPLDSVVREAALVALESRIGRGADGALIDALEADDPGLVRTAARLLAGTPSAPETLVALERALPRFSRATDRDTREALRARLREQGPRGDAIAAQYPEPDTWSFPSPGLPSPERLLALETATLVLEVEGAGVLEIQFFPFEAPTTAARLAALAESGALNGRTLHRSVPNFVVQGGSPFGNEYAGNGDYTRDELGRLGHWKGTLGVSTRGRDTGDGQLFINTVDNLRLDHDYTVLGVVRGDLEALAGIQEGARIIRAGLR